jgi:hypothetical protein
MDSTLPFCGFFWISTALVKIHMFWNIFLEFMSQFLSAKLIPNVTNSLTESFKKHFTQKRYIYTHLTIGVENKHRVCHTVPLPFTLKSILRQKKNYGNSNISSYKNITFKKSSKRNQNPSRYYNSITNLKFQHKPKYHLSKILI